MITLALERPDPDPSIVDGSAVPMGRPEPVGISRPSASPGATVPLPRSGPRLVIVDDDVVVRGALRELLEGNGLDVVGEAGDGAEAVEVVTRLQPDVVIMDNRMPVLHGIGSTRRIKEHLPFVQVVILTAYDEMTLSHEAMEAGAYCYVVKGGPPALLVDMVLRAALFKAELEKRAAEGWASGRNR